MDVLITGAGGRIGSELAQILVKEGHTVRGLGPPGDPGLLRIAEELEVVPFFADLTEAASIADAVRGVDSVCHLAAALTTHDVKDQRYVDVNFVGTYNLLTAVRDHAPEGSRFVYTSSDAVYWPALDKEPLYLPVDEAHPLTAGSVYGATKIGAEAMCRAFWRSYGVPYVIMRPTATASPNELVDPASPFGRRWFMHSAIDWLRSHSRSPVEDALLDRLLAIDEPEGKLLILTNAEGVASLTMITDARDVAGAMRLMIDSREATGEAFNVGPRAPHSERELVTVLGAALDLEVVEVPYEAVRPSWYVSSAKAMSVLGYRPERSVFDMVAEATGEQRS